MSLFLYPKSKVVRQYAPRLFKHYRSYKPYLQREFSRVCAYCRQPDSSAPNLNFGVDHYRPQSVPRFRALNRSYSNLFYCCGSCNSRKNAYWPDDEATGQFVVNPCDYAMADHIRFEASTGKVVTRTPNGVKTEELLQLNAEELIFYRLMQLHIVSRLDEEICGCQRQVVELAKHLARAVISRTEHDDTLSEIEADIATAKSRRAAITGEAPLPPLRRFRLGMQVHA